MSKSKVVGKLRVLKTKEECNRPESMWGKKQKQKQKQKHGNFHFWERDQIYPSTCNYWKTGININMNINVKAYKTLDIKEQGQGSLTDKKQTR